MSKKRKALHETITEEQWKLSALWNVAYWYGRDHDLRSRTLGLDEGLDASEKRIAATKARHIRDCTGVSFPVLTSYSTLFHRRG